MKLRLGRGGVKADDLQKLDGIAQTGAPMPSGSSELSETLRRLACNWRDKSAANNPWRQVSMDKPVRQRTRTEREKR